MGIYKQNGTKAWIWRKRIEGKVFVKSTRTTNRSLAEKIAREYDREALEQRLLGELENVGIRCGYYVYTKIGRMPDFHRCKYTWHGR